MILINISIHAPRTGSDASKRYPQRNRGDFNPRSPHGERPEGYAKQIDYWAISIHAPRTGSDDYSRSIATTLYQFQSTLPARGATSATKRRQRLHKNFNPRSPHGERRVQFQPAGKVMRFQSTLPARGATPWGSKSLTIICLFQSTLPARGATQLCTSALMIRRFQSTLPARGATLPNQAGHAPGRFQSTLPARGATPNQAGLPGRRRNFNPRSPHGERRGFHLLRRRVCCHFNPRSPHGERPSVTLPRCCICGFQSTLPARGATSRIVASGSSAPMPFQSTLPARGATGAGRLSNQTGRISIHAPRTGSDGIA